MRSSKPAVILVLLVFAVTINYIDRGSLSVAKTNVGEEFKLDDVKMGWLFSAFSASYAICHLAAGWLVDRYSVKWVYAFGFLIWSLATVGMGLANGLVSLLILRVLLGAGESVAFPATSRVIVDNFNEQQRGLANALIDAGTKIGPALSTLVGGLVLAHYGWRALFIVVGVGSLVWLVPWLLAVPSEKHASHQANAKRADATPMKDILKRPELWGTSLGFFCLGYAWYFVVYWLPSYLREGRGFTTEEMAVYGSLPFWAMAATSLTGGWMSDRWISAGATPTKVRRTFLFGGLLLCALFMWSITLAAGSVMCIVLLIAACASLGLYTSNVWAVTQTLAGPTASGQWTGVQNFVGNLGGVVSPLVTGWIVKSTGSYTNAFIISSIVLLAGVGAYLTLVPRVQPIQWSKS
ncbi:sugar phosphate permease [Roseimicrobium gellanilyticum]|uniref:Sugar phosphate permease n=1 Tax=Roseimicrobium gellanilyticum TaxID=748857 RepID=A0A366HIU4_9BACT|nr:MFS transporter [Roseimicrobium gellanilyticum]RBP42582.1 sugar phosphate permease [Roseimicrobium gellanilyticum]